jgi:NDP-sugar pyrophosphorylase family protein
MNRQIRAFVPAAGRGERLRPITDHIPKPLVPVLGKPVLESVLQEVMKLPVNGIGMNLHYKKDDLKDWILRSSYGKKVQLFPEEPLLGTGGALKHAESFLRECTFIVHNADVLSDFDLKELVELHERDNNLVTLAAVDYPEINTLCIDEKGCLIDVGDGNNLSSEVKEKLTFTGIAVYSPEFLKFIPPGVSSIVEAWAKAISSGYKIDLVNVTGSFWSDMGNPSSYASVVFERLRREGETLYIHPSASGCGETDLGGYVVLERDSIVRKSAYIRNCIILPGTHTECEGDLENVVMGEGFSIELREREIFPQAEGSDMIVIGIGGSDRKYHRVRRGRETSVLMQCSVDDRDFERHMEYTKFFMKHDIPVPELILVEPEKKRARFEDLGDLSLYSWLKCPRESGQIEEMYRKVLDVLLLIHTHVTENVSECPLLQERVFDYDHFRWETRYFVERFVMGFQKEAIPPSGLDEEFHRLALKADSFSKTVIHRDFQSQNIMISRGGIPRVIDYQGARIGPPAYDVASILWDPYFRLDENVRENLLEYYTGEVNERAGESWNMEDFRESLLSCRLQRHMQALGAYGFLSAVKGKTYFLKHVPEALRLLREDMWHVKAEYPALSELIRSFRNQ